MKVTMIKAGLMVFYRFTRSDGRLFVVGRTYGNEPQIFVDNKHFSTPFCLPLNLSLVKLVSILQGLKFDKTLQDQILKLDN